MESNLQIRISKAGQNLFKKRSYQINVHKEEIKELNFKNPKISYSLTPGKYTVEIIENNFSVKKEIVLIAGKLQVITINPSITKDLFKGVIIGMGIATILIQYLFLNKFSPILLITLLPFYTLFTTKNSENFIATVSK
jgi:predicted phage tail protein